MALKTINGKVTGPSGGNPVSPLVVASLSQGAVISGTSEVVPADVQVTPAVDGTYAIPSAARSAIDEFAVIPVPSPEV